jgi:hypothetical protein
MTSLPQIASLPNWVPSNAEDGAAFEQTAFLAAFFRPSAFSDDDVWCYSFVGARRRTRLFSLAAS